MKKMETWKKIIFIAVAIIVFARIGYIGVRGEINKAYDTSAAYDLSNATEIPCQSIQEKFISKQDRLNSLELIFNHIAEEKTGFITLCIYRGEALIYQTNISLANINNMEWKRVYVNAELKQGEEYAILLNASEDCVQIPTVLVVSGEAAPEILSSASGRNLMEGTVAINYGYLMSPGIWDRLSVVSLWIILLLLVFVFLYYFENLLRWLNRALQHAYARIKPELFATVTELVACTIIIGSSGIEFQAPTKVLLYVISLVAMVGGDEKKKFIKTLADNDLKKAFLYFLYAYAAFSLVGQRIFIYPLALKITTAGIFVFVVALFWFVPIIQTLFYYLDLAWKNGFAANTKIRTPIFSFVCVLILLLPAAYNLFANNPGISSPDTYGCMIGSAQHLHGMGDWHPAFYCMVLRAIETVWNSTYAVIAVQYFFWAYVVLELLLYLRKKAMNEATLIVVALFTGLNAGNFIHINTIWKDIPYTLSLFWALVILAKLSIDYEEYKHKGYIYLELIVSLVGVYFYRKNGVVSFAVIALMLAFLLRNNWKAWCSLAISVVLIITIKGPVYHYFDVQDSGKMGMYIGLSQDILGVYYAEGEVSESTLQMINVMTNYNNAEYSYTPTWSRQSYALDVETSEFIMNYIDTFLKNPVIMTRAIIAREDAVWDIYAGQDAVLGCVNSTGTQDGVGEWNNFYQKRKYVSLATEMSAATAYTANTQWIAAIEWRCGLFALLGLVSIIFLLLRCGFGKYILIVSPTLGHILSLLLSTGWSDFRYFWPLNLLNMATVLLVVVILKQENRRWEKK